MEGGVSPSDRERRADLDQALGGQIAPRLAVASLNGGVSLKRPDDGAGIEEDQADQRANGFPKVRRDFGPPITPSEMVRHLDRSVIGSPRAKRALAVAAYYHQVRMRRVPGFEMVERVLRDHCVDGKSATDEKLHELTRAITAAIRENPISNRRDSRARKDVCSLLRLYEDQQFLAIKEESLPANRARSKLSKGGRSRRKYADNPSGRYAALVDAFVRERRHTERTSLNRGPLSETSRDVPLIIGQSGSGKTMLARHVADRLWLPFVHFDASQLTESGWSGADVSSIPEQLLKAAEKLLPKGTKRDRVRLASHGVVFIDEIDKKAWVGEGGHDISRGGAQGNLLMTLDGFVDHETGVDLSTCFFICGGSFSGASVGMRNSQHAQKMLIAQIVERRLGLATFGFGTRNAAQPSLGELLDQVGPKDLIEFGIIPELAGRLQPVSMEPMTEALLMRIMEESRESPLRQRSKRLASHGIELRITEDGKRLIAKAVLNQGLGARPLRLVVSRLIEDLEF
ncbi:MAG: AAA family ATPase, partial [Oligoflexia bacterium]|nr:AAA family ATPase [Oligoflexia bacterium]